MTEGPILSAALIGVLTLLILAVYWQLRSTVRDPKWMFIGAFLRGIHGRPAYRRRRRKHQY